MRQSWRIVCHWLNAQFPDKFSQLYFSFCKSNVPCYALYIQLRVIWPLMKWKRIKLLLWYFVNCICLHLLHIACCRFLIIWWSDILWFAFLAILKLNPDPPINTAAVKAADARLTKRHHCIKKLSCNITTRVMQLLMTTLLINASRCAGTVDLE